MGLLVCMLLGTFIGWLIAALKEVDEGIFSKMGIGLLGGLLGGVTASIFNSAAVLGHITLLGSIASLIGAFILLGITNSFTDSAKYDQSDPDLA